MTTFLLCILIFIFLMFLGIQIHEYDIFEKLVEHDLTGKHTPEKESVTLNEQTGIYEAHCKYCYKKLYMNEQGIWVQKK